MQLAKLASMLSAHFTRRSPNSTPNTRPAEKSAAGDGSGHARYLDRARLPNLDGLRGIAILMVLVHHVPATGIAWLAQVQEQAKHGVSLFFVISGYIVMTLLLREIRRDGSVDVGAFLWRRSLRLWPLYFAVLALEAVLVFGLGAYSAENQALFAEKLPCYVLYCSNWLETSGQGPFFVSWSLAVEEQFYLAVALLMLAIPGRTTLAAVFGVLLVGKVFLVHGFPGVDLAALPGRVILSYSEAILMGTLLACLLDARWGYRLFMRTTASRFTMPFLLLVFLVCLAFLDLSEKSGFPALVFYVISALIVGAAATGKPLPVLDGPLLSRIGLYSYGIYLMHMPVLSAMKRIFDSPAWVLVSTFAVVLPIAWFSFHFFESPIRRLGRLRNTKALKDRPVPNGDHVVPATTPGKKQRIIEPV